jgi:hypothetical protein
MDRMPCVVRLTEGAARSRGDGATTSVWTRWLWESIALLYVGAVLARRLDAANRTLIELKSQLQVGQSRSAIEKNHSKDGRSAGLERRDAH